MQGCPLACIWCHNPETRTFRAGLVWTKEKCIGCLSCVDVCLQRALKATAGGIEIDWKRCELCGQCADHCPSLAMEMLGKEMNVEQVLAELKKDAIFYQQSGGGVTLSGGEPLSQQKFTEELLRRCKETGFHTAVDTCGYAPVEVFDAVLPYVDLFLYDIKHLDDAIHRKYTQVPIAPILDNLSYIVKKGANVWVRVPIIPTINDSPEHIRRIGELMDKVGLGEIYLLPYHKMAISKYSRLNLPCSCSFIEEPCAERMQELSEILTSQGMKVQIGG